MSFIRAQKVHFRDYVIFVYFAAQKCFIIAQKVHFRDYGTKKLRFRFAKMVKRHNLKKYFIIQLANRTGLKSVKKTCLLDA